VKSWERDLFVLLVSILCTSGCRVPSIAEIRATRAAQRPREGVRVA